MNTMKIEAVENAEVLKKPVDKIYEIADKEKGVEDIKFKSFSYAVKDQNNNIIGGITGWRAFDEIYIDELCIDKSIRGKGIGRKLVEIVEKEINDGTCENINLITNKYQDAIGFYKKLDFKVEFIRKHKNSKFNKYYMVKVIK